MFAVALAVVAIEVFAAFVDLDLLRVIAALCLSSYGVYRLALGYRHKFRAGMVAGFGDLTLWSFFMATAHGAGLMMAPILLAMPGCLASGSLALAGPITTAVLSVVVHSAAMIATAGLVAWVIFARVGLSVLRRGWINIEQVWSGMLVLAGLAALVLVGPDVVQQFMKAGIGSLSG